MVAWVSGAVSEAELEYPYDDLGKMCRRYADPLFFHDSFLSSGHDQRTRNGTATFVRFKGKHYVCTCRHIADAVNEKNVFAVRTNHPTMSMAVGRVWLNLSFFDVDGLQSIFRSPAQTDGYEVDVSIAPDRKSTRLN